MRIPPLYEKPTWQRFFVGIFFGSIISWFVFLFIFGELQEDQLKEIVKQQSEIKELKNKNQLLEKDFEELNEKNQKQLKVRDISITLTNDKQLKLDSLTTFFLKNGAKEELKHVLNNNIETVVENKELVIKTLENKTFEVDDQKYKLIVKQLYLFTTLELYLEIEKIS